MPSIASIILLLALAPLAVAALMVACLWLPGPRTRLPQASGLDRGSRPDAAAKVTLGVGAALMLLYSVTDGLRRFWGWRESPDRPEFRWWDYAEELLGAAVVVLCVLVLLRGFRYSPAVPVAPTRPRTWRSFTRPGRLWLLLAATVVLLGFVALTGSASSPGPEGVYNRLIIDTGGEYSASTIFFGWAYGIPVAIAALLLVALALTDLHINATRPFSRPESVAQEETSRSMLSALTLWFSTGVILDALAHALLQVSRASGLTMHAQEFSWETSLAALSPTLQWASYAVETLAYVLLLLVVTVAARRRRRDGAAARGSSSGQRIEDHG